MLVVHIPSWFPIPEKPLNGNFIFRHIESLGDRARSVILHHVHDGFTPETALNAELFPVAAGGAGKLALVRAYENAFDELVRRHGRPDILHLHVALPLGPVAVRLSRKHRIPLIVSEHWTGYLPMNRPQLTMPTRLILRHTFRHAAHITAVSQNLLDNIAASVPVAAHKPQTVVGNVVNTETFSLSDNTLQDGKRRILHVSTIENKAKNIMGILRAIKTVSAQRADFELNIVHDYENEEAAQFVRDNGLENTVHFLGRRTPAEIAALLRQSDFFLLFSNYENQPCVLLESFCTGTPVVTTPVGGIPEIADESNALIVTPKDEAQLADKVNFMLDNRQQFHPAEIRRKALHICSPEVIGDKWITLYRSLM